MDEKTELFDEISVERINIVDEKGVVRMAISNGARFPNPIIAGKEFVTNRRPSAGIIFFNDDGDECGGLSFGNRHAELLFDRYNQDQIVGMTYSEKDGKRRYGLTVWDRSDRPISELVAGLEKVRAIPEGPERDAAEKDLREEFPAPVRLFAGKEPDGSVSVVLSDSRGRERIRIGVSPDDTPKVQVLDENGAVVADLLRGR